MRWLPRAALGLVPVCLFTAMCSKPTGLVVSVDTDLAIGTDLDEIVISVARDGETTPKDKRATLGAPGSPTLPLSLGVETGPDIGVVVVTARGLLHGQEVVTRTARITATDGEEKLVALDLCSACRASKCSAPSTCISDGSCLDPTESGVVYDGSALPRHTCGQPPVGRPAVDGGGGGTDASPTSTDGGDSGTDGSPLVDAGPDACAKCPAGTVCGAGFCTLVDPAGTDCGNGVDVSLGATIRGRTSGAAINAACNTAGSYDYTLRVFQTKTLPPGVTAWRVFVKRLSGQNVASKVIPQNTGCQAEFNNCVEADTMLTVGSNAKFAVGGRNGNSQEFELVFTPVP